MKKEEKLLEELGKIDEDLVPEVTDKAGEEVSKPSAITEVKMAGNRKKAARSTIWLSIGAVAAAAVLAIVMVPKLFKSKEEDPITAGGNVSTETSGLVSYSSSEVTPSSGETVYEPHMMASPVYPDMPQNPEVADGDWDANYTAWHNAVGKLRNQPSGYKDGYEEYYRKVLSVIFSDVGDTDNRVFSPLGLYMALSMTAEASDGATRQQILDVLCQPDIETLRSHAKSLWLSNYMNDGLAKLVLGNSLWLNSSKTYRQELLEILATEYFASAYCGDPSESSYNEAFRAWINRQTDDLLKDYVSQLSLDPDLVLGLVSTVNYCGKWSEKFEKSATAPSTFHAASGDETCSFMNQLISNVYFYLGENFIAVSLNLLDNGEMRLYLPAEGMTPEELLKDEELLTFMMAKKWDIDPQAFAETVDTYIPKFDISSEIELQSYLEQLGVSDAFSTNADFSPLTEDASGLSITSIVQDSRVMIDEEGCKAASVTVVLIGAGDAPAPIKEVRFDRPFVFEIMSETGIPLFVGVVNNPNVG